MKKHWNPKDLILLKNKPLHIKLDLMNAVAKEQLDNDQSVYARTLESISNTGTEIFYPESKTVRKVRMFGSNNYLGLANDSRVKEAAKKAIDVFGTSMCGSPILNGNSKLLSNLEEKTANLKKAEDCIVFSAGFNANTAWTSAILRPKDTVYFDEEAHMSFREGLKSTKAKSMKFKHNDLDALDHLLSLPSEGEKYIYTESLFSMTGDVLDIKKACAIAEKHNALLFVDEAHGTGTLGQKGTGITEYLEHESDNIVTIGTYSKSLGANGGFICGNKKLINYLRILSTQYMFSAALAPSSAAAAIKAIDILESEPERVKKLNENCAFSSKTFKDLNNLSGKNSPIVYLHIGDRFDVILASKMLEEKGFFINPISFPAVGKENSGLRITLSSEHTKTDILELKTAIEQVWKQLENE